MTLFAYLGLLEQYIKDEVQKEWFEKLQNNVKKGYYTFQNSSKDKRQHYLTEFKNRVNTEELKAWYSSPDGEVLFQGTSISSLTVPCELSSPLVFNDIADMENAMAEHYIRLHNKYAQKVKDAILENNTDEWIKSGLYYGIVISSKVISQAFQLKLPYGEVVFKVKNKLVDPHEITSYPQDVREEYFKTANEKIKCFGELDIRQEELESSLILADISKPKIESYKDNILLAPIKCNELATIIANRVKELIIEKTSGDIHPKSLSVTIYDTDTPYTYHHVLRSNGQQLSPILPGLIILGSSGTIDAIRWLYLYRISLIAQKIQKSSLYSVVHKKFIPFVYFGVLVPRDADILLEMQQLDKLRYRGNIDPEIEFCYILPIIVEFLENNNKKSIFKKLRLKAR